MSDQVEHDLLKKDEVEDTVKLIYAPYRDKKMKAWLENRYPILGVRD